MKCLKHPRRIQDRSGNATILFACLHTRIINRIGVQPCTYDVHHANLSSPPAEYGNGNPPGQSAASAVKKAFGLAIGHYLSLSSQPTELTESATTGMRVARECSRLPCSRLSLVDLWLSCTAGQGMHRKWPGMQHVPLARET